MRLAVLMSTAFLLGAASPAPCETVSSVDARLLWRSGEVRGGVLIGSMERLSATARGVFGFDSQTDAVLYISADADTSSLFEIEGEAPGHVTMVLDADVAPGGGALALVQGPAPARAVVRVPVAPPFVRVETLESTFEGAGFPAGGSIRIVGGHVAVHRGWQPAKNLRTRYARLDHYDLADGTASMYVEAVSENDGILDGVMTWVWDLGPDGSVYLNDDYHEPRIRAVTPTGEERFDVRLTARTVRKSAELIRSNLESYEKMREIVPDMVPEVIETYRAIVEINARSGPSLLYVTTSAGMGRGDESVEQIEWWVLDADSGRVLRQESLRMPDGQWTTSRVAWFGDRIYVLGIDASRDGQSEILCFERRG